MSERMIVGQRNMPPKDEVDEAFRAIFSTSYFANNGPLVQALDRDFARTVGAEYAVCVTNDMMAMMLLAKSVFEVGDVVVPAYISPLMVEALAWGGYTPIFADVDAETMLLSRESLLEAMTPQTKGIVGVHFLGHLSNAGEIEAVSAEHGLPLIFDAGDALGNSIGGRKAGTFGLAEVFSFNEDRLLNGAEGGCVTTSDLNVANKMRTLRNFHPGQTFVQMPLRMNGKMAEAPAALVLAGMPLIKSSIQANRERYDAYRGILNDVVGVNVVVFPNQTSSYTRIIAKFHENARTSSADVAAFLSARGIEARPAFNADAAALQRAPNAKRLQPTLLELPNCSAMTVHDAETVARLIADRCKQA